MRRDRYARLNRFALGPALGMTLDPVLRPRDTLLDEDTLVQAVPAAVARRRPRPLMDGRPSTPVEVLLRLLSEGHISGLKRRHQLERCRDHGTAGMARGVGWGVIAHTRRVLAQATAV